MKLMRIASLLWASSMLVLSASVMAEESKDIDAAAAKIAVQICANCHGPGGHSISPVFPRLAGQQEMYLAAQIKAFRAKQRGDPEAHDYMWGMATLLDDPMVAALAKYFSSQPPAKGTPGDPKLIERGREIFAQGDKASGTVACANCHGAEATGNSVFPRLAGQHAPYIVRQLQVIQTQLRASPIMHGVVKGLGTDEMKAVAEYLQSL